MDDSGCVRAVFSTSNGTYPYKEARHAVRKIFREDFWSDVRDMALRLRQEFPQQCELIDPNDDLLVERYFDAFDIQMQSRQFLSEVLWSIAACHSVMVEEHEEKIERQASEFAERVVLDDRRYGRLTVTSLVSSVFTEDERASVSDDDDLLGALAKLKAYKFPRVFAGFAHGYQAVHRRPNAANRTAAAANGPVCGQTNCESNLRVVPSIKPQTRHSPSQNASPLGYRHHQGTQAIPRFSNLQPPTHPVIPSSRPTYGEELPGEQTTPKTSQSLMFRARDQQLLQQTVTGSDPHPNFQRNPTTASSQHRTEIRGGKYAGTSRGPHGKMHKATHYRQQDSRGARSSIGTRIPIKSTSDDCRQYENETILYHDPTPSDQAQVTPTAPQYPYLHHPRAFPQVPDLSSSIHLAASNGACPGYPQAHENQPRLFSFHARRDPRLIYAHPMLDPRQFETSLIAHSWSHMLPNAFPSTIMEEPQCERSVTSNCERPSPSESHGPKERYHDSTYTFQTSKSESPSRYQLSKPVLNEYQGRNIRQLGGSSFPEYGNEGAYEYHNHLESSAEGQGVVSINSQLPLNHRYQTYPDADGRQKIVDQEDESLRSQQNHRPSFIQKQLRKQQGGHHSFDQDQSRYQHGRRQILDREQSTYGLGCQDRFDREQTQKQQKRRSSFRNQKLPPPPDDCVLFISGFPTGFDKRALSKMIGPLPGLIALTDPRISKPLATSSLANAIFLDPHFAADALRNLPTMRFAAMQGQTLSVRPFDSSLVHPRHVRRLSTTSWSDRSSGSVIEHNPMTLAVRGRRSSMRADHAHRSRSLDFGDEESAQKTGCIAELTTVGNDHEVSCEHTNADGGFEEVFIDDIATVIQGSQVFDLALRTAKSDDIAIYQVEGTDSNVHITGRSSLVATGDSVKKTRWERTSPPKTPRKKIKDSTRGIPIEHTRDPSLESITELERPTQPLPKNILQDLWEEEAEQTSGDLKQSNRSSGSDTSKPVEMETEDLLVDTTGSQPRPMQNKQSSDGQTVKSTKKDSKDVPAQSVVSEDQAQANQNKQSSKPKPKPKRPLHKNTRNLSAATTEAVHSLQSMYPLEARPAGSVNEETVNYQGTSSKSRTRRTQSNQSCDATTVISTRKDNMDVQLDVSEARDSSAPQKQTSEAQSVESLKIAIYDTKARPCPKVVLSGAKLEDLTEDRNLKNSQDEAGAFTSQTTYQSPQSKRPCGKDFVSLARKESVILPEPVSATRDTTTTIYLTEASLLDATQLTPNKADLEPVAQGSAQITRPSDQKSEDSKVEMPASPPISAGAQPDPIRKIVREQQPVALAEGYPLLQMKKWAAVASPGNVQHAIPEQDGPRVTSADAASCRTFTVQSSTKIAVSENQQRSDAEASQREFAARVVRGPVQGNNPKQKGRNRHPSNSANSTNQQWGPKSQISGAADASDSNAKGPSSLNTTGRHSSVEAQGVAKEQQSVMKGQVQMLEPTDQQSDMISQAHTASKDLKVKTPTRIKRMSATRTASRSPERLAIPPRSTSLAQCSTPFPIVAYKKKREYIAVIKEQVDLNMSTLTTNKLEEYKQEQTPLIANDSSTIEKDPTDSIETIYDVLYTPLSSNGITQNPETSLLPSKENSEEISAFRSTLSGSKASVTPPCSPSAQPLSSAGPLPSNYSALSDGTIRACEEVSSLKSKNNRKKNRNGKKKNKKHKHDGKLSSDMIPLSSTPVTQNAASTKLKHAYSCHGTTLGLEENSSKPEMPWDAEASISQSMRGSVSRHGENENADMSSDTPVSLSDRNNGNGVRGHEADTAQTLLFTSGQGRTMTALDDETEFTLCYSKKMACTENMKAPGPYRRWKKIEALPAAPIPGSDKATITQTMRESGLTDASSADHFGIPERPRLWPTKTDLEDMSEDSFMLRHNSYESGLERIQNLCEAEEETQGSLYARILTSERLENCSKGVKIHRAPMPKSKPMESRSAPSKDSAGHVVHEEEQTHRNLMRRERVIALDHELHAVIREAVQTASTFASDEEDLQHGRLNTLESGRANRILKVATLRETYPLNPEIDWDEEWHDEWCNEAAEWLFEHVPRLTEGQKKMVEEWEKGHPSMRKNLVALGFTVPEIIELGLEWAPQPWFAGVVSSRRVAQDADAESELATIPINIFPGPSCGQPQELGERISSPENLMYVGSDEGNKEIPDKVMVKARGEKSRSKEKMMDEFLWLKVEATIKQLEEMQTVAKKKYPKQHRKVGQNELLALGLSEHPVAKGRETSATLSTSTRNTSSPSKVPRPSATPSLPNSSSGLVAEANLEAARETAVEAIAKTSSMSKSVPQAPPMLLAESPAQRCEMGATDSIVSKSPVVPSTSCHAPLSGPATSRPSYASVVAQRSNNEGKAANTWETQGGSAWGLVPATLAIPVAAAADEAGGDD